MSSNIPNLPSAMQKMMDTVEAGQEDSALRELVQENASSPLKEDWRDNINTQIRRPVSKKDMKTRADKVSKAFEAKEKLGTVPIAVIKKAAEKFEQRNPELKSKTLISLRQAIKPSDTKEQILQKVKSFFEDISLVDEALEFLIETSEGELAEKIRAVKEELNNTAGREIRAGRNISTLARQASQDGLGTPTSMRDLYRDITGNPREPTTLFQELSGRYEFKDLKKVIDFLLHSAGADLKSKGPSIPRGLLHNLLQETRALQAILGVYTFFRGRMPLVEGLFAKDEIPLPKELTFESLAKQFMLIVQDRYPNADKILQGAKKLGINDWVQAKIIAFSQLRDAIREVALHQVYRSVQHREEVLTAIIAALEALEEELESILEEEAEEEEFGEDDKEDEEEF